MSLVDLPVLFKRSASGALRQWQVRVEPADDGTATLVVSHGEVGGAQQELQEVIRQGKNIGRKNETTPIEQAVAEATARWTKQRDRNKYGLSPEESENKIAIAPMLAQVFEDHVQKINWEDHQHLHVQPKFDGHRCLAICDGKMNIRLVGRRGVEIDTCPHIVDQLHLMPPNSVFDGELYIHGEPLNKIGSYIKRKQAGSANLCFMVYDIADPKRPFADRFRLLEDPDECHGLRDATHLHLARTQPITSQGAAQEFQAMCLEHGFEGAMVRHGTAGYEPGKRSHSLLKMKTFYDDEFTIVGSKEGRGQFEGMAVFECVTAAGHKFDATAPGTHEEKREAWQNRNSYLGKRLIIKYQYYTTTEEPVPFPVVAKGYADDV